MKWSVFIYSQKDRLSLNFLYVLTKKVYLSGCNFFAKEKGTTNTKTLRAFHNSNDIGEIVPILHVLTCQTCHLKIKWKFLRVN